MPFCAILHINSMLKCFRPLQKYRHLGDTLSYFLKLKQSVIESQDKIINDIFLIDTTISYCGYSL